MDKEGSTGKGGATQAPVNCHIAINHMLKFFGITHNKRPRAKFLEYFL